MIVFMVISCIIWCIVNTNVVAAFDKLSLLTPEEGCGITTRKDFKKVVGGEPAPLGAWPWLALLGYTNVQGELKWLCGGSLITARHVLTAAHCLKSTLTTVRLGEHDLSVETETDTVDVPIIKVAKHPEYSKTDKRNDLAILYLERTVDFTTKIRPICIPFSEPLRSQNFDDYLPFLAGWGLTEESGNSSNVLIEIQTEVVSNEVCRRNYTSIGRIVSGEQFDATVLCTFAQGKDSCKGDSGEPLMYPELIGTNFFFYQIGVVSYGVGCARDNVPGVYARVQTFVDWIQEKVSE